MKVRIKDGSFTDASDLKKIDSLASSNPKRAQQIDDWLMHDVVRVLLVDERVTGYAVLDNYFFHYDHIEMLMIAEAQRGKRLGQMLIEDLEQLAETGKMFTSTNLSNTMMQRLLSRIGYRTCGYIDELDPGDPEIVYVKNLKKEKAKA